MPGEPFGARRPRPVADVPPAALADGQVPAKGWLLALVAARPLAAAADLPTASLAREAPMLCAAMLRAIGSDGDLARLERGDLVALATQAGALAGATEPAAVAEAVGALRSALWEALADTAEDAAHATALGRRLALVCDVVLARALSGEPAAQPLDAPAAFVPPSRAPLAAVPAPAPPVASARTVQEAIGARDGTGFALLAVEVDDAERLAAADRDGAFGAALTRVEQALRNELRPADTLVREAEGRWWLVAAELGEGGGRSLAERVADAVASIGGDVPLAVSMGVASAPADGSSADELTGRAERGLFASRAAGVPLA